MCYKAKLETNLINLKEILENMQEDYNVISKKQSQLDQIKVDIEHEIELNKLSGSQMMIKYKELKATLVLRRRYKDDLEYYHAVRKSMNLKLLDNANKSIADINKSQNKRKYTHRVKQELREEILKEIENI